MNTCTLLRRLLALLACAAPLSAQVSGVVLFRGAPGGFGPLEVRDLALAGPVQLPFGSTPVRLLPIEVNGRTELARVAGDQSWRSDDVPGASRIRLPAEHGSIYHYELAPGVGAHAFGFFLVDAGGQLLPLVQLSGIGPAGDQNPLVGRVAIASDGNGLLCATRPAAGGNLLEIDLQGGPPIDRTSAQPPLDWLEQSLFLAPQWGLAVHTLGVQRFPRTTAGLSTAINFGANPPTWYSGDVALASRGGFAVTIAGLSPLLADAYVIAANGALARATLAPAPISHAGYLPEEIDGPYLAVSDDGKSCAWRTEGATREAFLARVPWQAGALATQLTSNIDFIDTIDEVAQFAFRTNAQFVFTAGERAAPAGGVAKIDVFSASLPAGAVTASLVNLSLSSGIATPPFLLPGQIRPQSAVDVSGSAGRMLLDAGRDELVLLPPQGGGTQVILTQVKSFDDAVRSGDQWLLALRRTGPGQPRQVVRWSPLAPLQTQVLYSNANTDLITSLSLRGNTGAFVDVQLLGEQLWALDLSSAAQHLLSQRSFHYGSALALAANGELVTGLGAPAQNVVFARWLPPNAPKRLGTAGGAGFVLRGL